MVALLFCYHSSASSTFKCDISASPNCHLGNLFQLISIYVCLHKLFATSVAFPITHIYLLRLVHSNDLVVVDCGYGYTLVLSSLSFHSM